MFFSMLKVNAQQAPIICITVSVHVQFITYNSLGAGKGLVPVCSLHPHTSSGWTHLTTVPDSVLSMLTPEITVSMDMSFIWRTHATSFVAEKRWTQIFKPR